MASDSTSATPKINLKAQWRATLTPEGKAAQAALASNARIDEYYQPSWWLVEIPDGKLPTVKEYPDEQAIANRISEIDDTDVSVFIFFGARIPVTKPPFRCLKLPNGKLVKAFEDVPDADLEIEESGFLGRESMDLVEVLPDDDDDNSGEDDEDLDYEIAEGDAGDDDFSEKEPD